MVKDDRCPYCGLLHDDLMICPGRPVPVNWKARAEKAEAECNRMTEMYAGECSWRKRLEAELAATIAKNLSGAAGRANIRARIVARLRLRRLLR